MAFKVSETIRPTQRPHPRKSNTFPEPISDPECPVDRPPPTFGFRHKGVFPHKLQGVIDYPLAIQREPAQTGHDGNMSSDPPQALDCTLLESILRYGCMDAFESQRGGRWRKRCLKTCKVFGWIERRKTESYFCGGPRRISGGHFTIRQRKKKKGGPGAR